jgi:hypothetical protein
MKLNITQKLMVGFLVVLLCGTMSGAISYVSLDQIETRFQSYYSTGGKDWDRRIESIIKGLKQMKILSFALIMLDSFPINLRIL